MVTFLEFIHVDACSSGTFIFTALQYFTVETYHNGCLLLFPLFFFFLLFWTVLLWTCMYISVSPSLNFSKTLVLKHFGFRTFLPGPLHFKNLCAYALYLFIYIMVEIKTEKLNILLKILILTHYMLIINAYFNKNIFSKRDLVRRVALFYSFANL